MFTHKVERMQQILLEEINFLIITGKIKDPRLSHRISVVQATLSKDLTSCAVYVSAYFELEKIQQNADILNHARGFIQHTIAKKHTWKYTPKLFFKATDVLIKANTVLDTIQTLETITEKVPETEKESTNETDTQEINTQEIDTQKTE